MNYLLAATAALIVVGCGESIEPESVAPSENRTEAAVAVTHVTLNPERDAYFGDLHVHTRNSFDAFVFGTRRSPDDAYRFAQGEVISHDGGGRIQLAGPPLDFYAVTDHGEYMGVVPAMANPDHPLSQTETARIAFGADAKASAATFVKLGISFITQSPIEDIYDTDFIRATWQDTVATGDAHYRPGEFTTFAAYEFTAMKVLDAEAQGAANLHRNVIFENQAADMPYTTLDSGNPSDLWTWMEGEREAGRDSLAIPHNSNASNGWMFSLVDDNGEPIPSELLDQRRRNEPLVEITQVKGTSDTRPLISPEDPWAEFEHYPFLVGSKLPSTDAEGSYVRPSLGLGLAASASQGVNPFEFGVIGSSDTHVGAGSYVEETHWGKYPREGADPMLRGSVPNGPPGTTWENSEPIVSRDPHVGSMASAYSASGLAGVWAEANTREAIFAALKRRETFGTSGPRMKLRFFAGNYSKDMLDASNLLTQAYAEGVPMGAHWQSEQAPSMLVWATQDPLSQPLQRLQIIKVWRDTDGHHQEQIFDVACSDGSTPGDDYRCADNGATVDPTSCETDAGSGASEIKALWQDPLFQADQSAVYYVRALENPSCRWNTWDAVRAGTKPNPTLKATLQERAWSSPIWVNG